jgi:hypothetical protein
VSIARLPPPPPDFLLPDTESQLLLYGFDNICSKVHNGRVAWTVDFHDAFVAEYHGLPKEVQDELLACVTLLEQFGPLLGRPRVDTLNGSRHASMKELRFDAADGVWRFAFAFDSRRKAVILCGGDKSGGSGKRFYVQLINRADARFDAHVNAIKKQKRQERNPPR